MLALQRAALAYRRRDTQALVALSRDAQAAADPDDRYLHYVVNWYLAMAAFLEGRMVEADEALPAIDSERWAAGDLYAAMYATYAHSQAQRALGRFNAARRTCEDAVERFARVQPGTALPTLGIAQVGLAEVLLEQDNLDAAFEMAASGSELCEQLGYARWRITGLTTLARVLHARGEPDLALATFDEADPSLTDAEAVTDLLNPVMAEQGRIELAQNHLSAVEEWIRNRGLDERAEPLFVREPEYLVLARWLLAQDAPQRALALVRRWLRLAQQQQRLGSVLEMQVLEAAALEATGDLSGARSVISDALVAAEPEGAVRVFVNGGERIKSLLESLVTRRVNRTYVDRVLAAFRPMAEHRPASETQMNSVGDTLLEPLSERELEVLRLLASGMSNRQIADDLVVALDTVKKHVSHIFSKLGASSRTQAAARARELALL
jgi:LuxR family maltose regulon positive regulatory protein